MPRPSVSVLIAWPDGSAHRRLRAALMLRQVVPESLSWPLLLARVRATPAADRDRIVAFLDIADCGRPGAPDAAAGPRACDLLTLLPNPAERVSVWLSRTRGAAVSDAERSWALAQGFAGWIGDTASVTGGSELEATLQALAPRLGLGEIDPGGLARADLLVPVGEGHERWRAHVRTLTRQSAEDWARQLPLQLPVTNRRWRLREYPDCVVGDEVVGLWSRRHGLARGEAVVLGRAAVALGLMRHVAGEHDFEDAELFYELLDPGAGNESPLDGLRQQLLGPGGVVIADRTHLGRSYAACWVGSEAVDRLVALRHFKRAEARLALQRLMQLGFIEHVVHEQGLLDGPFFYRFTTPVVA